MTLSSKAKKRILKRISYHAIYDDSILDALEYAYENEFAGIQLAVDSPHLSFESMSEKSIKKIRSFLDNKNLYITIHAPDEAISIYTHTRYLRKGINDYCRAMFYFAERVRAPLVTIHTGKPTIFRTDSKPEKVVPEKDLTYYKNMVQGNLETMIQTVNHRLFLCVENFQLSQLSIRLINHYLDSNELFLCWDIAKSEDNPKIEKYLLSHKSHIKQMHLHDVRKNSNGSHRSHCVIGTGNLDFRHYLAKTSDADIIDYCIEVRPREKAKESLEALKLL